MGLLRLFLALSVVCQHSGKQWGIGGGRAVEIFFIISGFYMGLILSNGKYQNYRLYLINRFLRILPIYWIVALSTLFISLFLILIGFAPHLTPLAPYHTHGESLQLFSWVFYLFTNLFVFLQECTYFMGLSEGVFYFTKNFNASSPVAYTFLLIPQAWSLGIELLFYTIAPFFFWKKPTHSLYWLVLFILLSLICKISFWSSSYPYDPWSYRFFPSVLHLFLLGGLTYKLHASRALQRLSKKQLLLLASGLIILLLGYYGWFAPNKDQILQALWSGFSHSENTFLIEAQRISKLVFRSIIPYLLASLLIFVIFPLTSNNRLDRWLGELSYPLYVCHIMVIGFLTMAFPRNTYFPYLAISISLLCSIALAHWIQKPIDKIRAARVSLSPKEKWT